MSRASDGVERYPGPARPRVFAAVAAILVGLTGVAGFIALRPAQLSGDATPAATTSPVPPPVPEPRDTPLDRAILKALPSQRPQDAVEEQDDVAQDPQEITVDQLPRGDGTGIDAFPRPGTKPIQRGLVVPDGYRLPPGFVRHHQTTDSGEQLPPILKFHPDHVPPGAPADGIVPPELAPKDMPQKWLEPPPPRLPR